MADWVTGKVTKVQFWTDALFSLTLHAPVHPFTAGQFAKLGLISTVNAYSAPTLTLMRLITRTLSSIWSPSRTVSSAHASPR